MLKRSLISAVDQGMLSALNFVVGLTLIGAVSKQDYGLYVQLFASGVLLCGLIDAMVTTAVANTMSRGHDEGVEVLLGRAQPVARRLALLLGLVASVAVLVLLLLTHHPGDDAWVLALVFVAYVVSLMIRDFKRACFHLQQMAEKVLLLDGLFVAATLLGGAALRWYGVLDVRLALGILAGANLLAVWFTPKAVDDRGLDAGSQWWTWLKGYWSITRWALPGLATGWIGNNAFLYLTGLALGLAATAELNASRLLLMPVTLLTVAWQQMSRADIAHRIHAGDPKNLYRYLQKSLAMIGGATALYIGALVVAIDWILASGAFNKYTLVQDLLVWWTCYALMYAVKFVGTCALVGMEAYKPLLSMSVTSMSLQLMLLAVIPAHFGIESVLWCMMASELLELTVVWWLLLPRTVKARMAV